MKKVFFAATAVILAASVQAEYLYWQVDSSTASGLAYNGARVFVSNNNGVDRTYLNIGYGDFDTGSFVQFEGRKVQIPLYEAVVAQVDTSTYGSTSGYSFYIELINYSDASFVAQTDASSAMTYSQLEAAHFVGADLSPVSMAVWHGGSYTTVPEPTSAMLVLFGLAGLALKRRVA